MSGHYERLSFLDSSFLALESRTTHFHVAGLLILEAGPLKRPDGGIDLDRIRDFIASRLHLIPRYRQHLAYVPVERYPVWVDDEHFHIDYHIRHSSLPKPGSFDQLKQLMGRLSSQQLDRSKPLWELYVVEGLEDDRFAIISKIHHAMIDGISGVDLMAVLLDLAPVADVDPGPEFVPRPRPTGSEFLVRETARRAGRVAAALRSAQTLTEDVQSLAMQGARRVRAVRNSLGSGWLTPATKTPLNGTIGPNRRFGTLTTDLADVKEVKNALGGTVNDVILATVAGGVRRYLVDGHKFDVDNIDFRVMAPVSVRSPSERGTLGNQVAMWLVSLPVAELDPVQRLAAVNAETEKLKWTDQALGAASLVQMSSGAPTTLVSLASRLATGARPFNMTVTNVPGPQFPMYLLGSKLVDQYPLVPLWHGHGVGIALFSYNGVVSWGFNADYDTMEDLGRFVDAIEASFKELLAIARGEKPVTAAQPRSRRKSAPKKRPAMGATKSASGSEAAPQTASPKKRPPMGGTTAKKPVSKSAAAKKPVSKSAAAKKPVSKSAAAKKPVSKSAAAKKPASRSTVAKKPAAKTPAAKKSAAKTTAAKKSTASTAAGAAKQASAASKKPATSRTKSSTQGTGKKQ